jgi:lipoic acid synthetase
LKTVIADMRSWGVDILTLGQYLQPSRKHLPIERYYTPDEFRELKEYALGLGFKWAECGPLVRSSYNAEEQVRALSAVHRQLYGDGALT